MDTRTIEAILVKEYGYSAYEASVTAEDLIHLQPRFLPALQKWIALREETEIVIGAVSSTTLMKEKGLTFPAALVAMDWVATEPEVAVPVLMSDICH